MTREIGIWRPRAVCIPRRWLKRWLTCQPGEYRRNPYDYGDSDTAKRRARIGPSEGGTRRPAQARRERETTAEPQDSSRQERTTQQSAGGGTSQPQYQQTQFSHYSSSQSQPYNVQSSSYGYQQPRSDSAPTNINITMNAAQMGQGRTAVPGQYSAGTYNTSGYAQSTRQESEPPPTYQASTASRGPGSGPPQPPSHPGPDVFDSIEKPAISRTQGSQDRRGSTYDQPTQPTRRSGR
jgi:hypothetical protein